MFDLLSHSIDEAIRAANVLKEPGSIAFMQKLSMTMTQVFQAGGKILIAGNGGSLCDAMHFAEELTGQFREKRKALAAIALADPGHMSCVANDMGFDSVFSRSIEALGNPGDLFIALTTSGNSINLKKALLMAKEKGLMTASFLGKTGGEMRGLSDLEWIVSGFRFSDRIQEAHMAAIHIVIEQVERLMFSCSYAQH